MQAIVYQDKVIKNTLIHLITNLWSDLIMDEHLGRNFNI